nr:hypothetical protein [Paenibacillus sp. PCH8]
MSVIHPAGTTRLKQRTEQLVPKMIAMPLDVLLERYGQVTTRVAATAEESRDGSLVIDKEVLPE